MSNESARPFFGGVPTDIEMDILDEEYGEPEVDRFFSYEELESLLKINRKEHRNRFRTVMDRWKARLDSKYGLLLICKTERGYKIATNSERIEFSSQKHEQGIKKHRIAHKVSSATDDEGLSGAEIKLRDHTSHVTGMLLQHAIEQKRKLKTSIFKSLQPKQDKDDD